MVGMVPGIVRRAWDEMLGEMGLDDEGSLHSGYSSSKRDMTRKRVSSKNSNFPITTLVMHSKAIESCTYGNVFHPSRPGQPAPKPVVFGP